VTIELQPRVLELLRLNIALNQLVNVDLSKTGVGFGATSHQARIHIPQSFNVAGAQFKSDRDGQFVIARGDDILVGEAFDMIKIDTEGMECQVIDGLAATIARSHPLLFVEVWSANQDRFDEQMAQMGYVTVEEFRRYEVATNYLMRHRDDC
jgi:FkbM family methyltransferase